MKALFPEFDAAVIRMASMVLPNGFDVGEVAPSTLADLRAHVETTGRFLVWSGASDQTIFGEASTNHAFRAWHDWCHYTHNLPFSLDGERHAARVQIVQVRAAYPKAEADHFAAIIWAEVVGQAEHFAAFGDFPKDQRAFTQAYMQMVKP